MQKKTNTIPVILWLASGVLLVVAMVVIGGITRLTGSGLSIVEWNLLSGTFPPFTESEWQHTFDQYRQFPEYQQLKAGMTLSGFKQIFWWEYLHRLLGRATGIAFVLPFAYFLIRKQLSPWLTKRLFFILLLGMAQGGMGWFMVKSGLVDVPFVSHYRLAAHLTLALLLIGVILWTIADLIPVSRESRTAHPLPLRLGWAVVLGILLQVVLGAFVAGLKAGFFYNTWPLMQGELYPTGLYAGLEAPGFFDNGVALQFAHRWFAILVLGLIFVFRRQVTRQALPPKTRHALHLLLGLTFLQVGLGIATLVLAVPIILGVLHQLVAVLLFGVAVWSVHSLHTQNFKPALKV